MIEHLKNIGIGILPFVFIFSVAGFAYYPYIAGTVLFGFIILFSWFMGGFFREIMSDPAFHTYMRISSKEDDEK